MVRRIHMDMHPTGRIHLPAMLTQTPHNVLQFFHFGVFKFWADHLCFVVFSCIDIAVTFPPLGMDAAVIREFPFLPLRVFYSLCSVISPNIIWHGSKQFPHSLCRLIPRDSGHLNLRTEILSLYIDKRSLPFLIVWILSQLNIYFPKPPSNSFNHIYCDAISCLLI